MPTGNEYSDVRFGDGDQSYKQTDREMSGGVDGQVGGPGNPLPQGNYPRIFDQTTGSEPLGTESDDNPFYYPNRSYETIKCTGPGQSYVTTERESISGEFGQCEAQPTGPYPGTDMVPSPSPSKQFSSKMSGNPQELLNSTRTGIQSHSSLNEAYGLMQPAATIGSHPWLRDELTNTGESEAGNAVPSADLKLPKRA